MDETGAPPWPGADQFEAVDQDFGMLDFNNLDLDFALDFQHHDAAQHDANQQLTAELAHSLDAQHLENAFSPQVLPGQHHGEAGAQQQSHPMSGTGLQQPANAFFDFAMPQFNQAHMYRPHAGVPPTPNSTEMHADPTRYLQQMQVQEARFEQDSHIRKDDASFTPLVSPAVTPHEIRSQMADHTVMPGAYFSPLTSPALNAQNHQQTQGQLDPSITAASSAAASPLDIDMGGIGLDYTAAQPEQARPLRNNRRSAPRPANAPTRVRQSPIVKPNRRKATVAAFIPPNEVSPVVEEAQRPTSARPSTSGLEVPRNSDSSEFDSVSPETLSEMGPPPRPGSVTHSPAVFAQSGHPYSQGACPATPASLMHLQQSPSFSELTENMPMLDDLTLPEPSLEKPPLSRIDTAAYNDEGTTPRMSARKTPKLGPLSTPSAGAALSGKPSPILSAVASPTSPAFAGGCTKRPESKAGRNWKKRNSVSSTLVSPALRPKISPSIKPLISESGKSEDVHTQLLASKSNYQNILDGTTVPGVVYPTSLSTNLTSKRTSHKIAEQGRRNRINTALLEMQALLPSPKLGAKDAAAKSPELSSAAQSSNSKAAKVESAIEYIKQLQKECSEKDQLLSKKDQEVGALRKELDALKKGASTSSSAIAETEVQMQTGDTSNSDSEKDATRKAG